MSEIPAPYGHKGEKKSDIERIAHFMNGFLGIKLLNGIDLPKNFHKNYKDMTTEEQYELFEFAFHKVFGESAVYAAEQLKRPLKVVELNLIKRRVMDFLKQSGMEYIK